jgi:CCR4-NOT transcription complex subunit 4
MFLHEPGDESESFTRQDLSAMNANLSQSSRAHAPPPQHAPQPIASATMQMNRQESNDGSAASSDGPALPTSASWASKPIQPPPTSRTSRAVASSNASPATEPAKVEQEAPPTTSNNPEQAPESTTPSTASKPSAARILKTKSVTADFDHVMKAVSNFSFKFTFDHSRLSEEDQRFLRIMPPLFDPQGGAKRRAIKEREKHLQDAEIQAQAAIQQTVSETEDAADGLGGSLQLGGEPEERIDLSLGRNHHAAIGPPSQQPLTPGLGLGRNLRLTDESGHLNLGGPNLTQQQLLQQFKPNAQSGALNSFQGNQAQSSLGHGHMSTAPSHARQTSRFSFTNDSGSTVKPSQNQNVLKQQSSMLQQNSHFNQLGQPQGLGSNQFYGSSVQGPPPGLKATGTPPVTGGGMFGQGHNFTSGGLGYSANNGGRNQNEEMMRDLLRRGPSAGSNQISEAGKRELLFPFQNTFPTSSTPAPAPGLMSSSFGPPQSYQESVSQKQKKKGKKHRHANTSSSGGGGLVDVADPSILQARLHQQSGSMVGQGLYTGQGQGGFPSVYSGGFSRW